MPARIYPKRLPQLFILEWREKKGLTQQQLADRIGTSDATISRWENRERRPDVDALAAICEALGIELTDIYEHPDKPSANTLLRGQPADVVENFLKMIQAVRR